VEASVASWIRAAQRDSLVARDTSSRLLSFLVVVVVEPTTRAVSSGQPAVIVFFLRPAVGS